MSDALENLDTLMAEVTDLQYAAALLAWDEGVYMPPGGVSVRGEPVHRKQ